MKTETTTAKPPTKASVLWRKTAGPQLRAAIVDELPTRCEFDREYNANREVHFTNHRAIIAAKLVDSDFRLVVDAAPDEGLLDGLRASTFEGLNKDDKGRAWAYFTNGRALRYLTYEVTKLTDRAEITARELKHARITRQSAAVAPAATVKTPRRKVVKNRNGGRPTTDGPETTKAVHDVLAARRKNKKLSMKAACVFQIKEHGLDIQWEGLAKHVRKAQRAKAGTV
ncbi:MAG TPA: hypothetical protein DCS43_07975 [Verrucomicrobia bacterium]|nr:hypothetical protein [Verrucomicrobiota bacterium]